jgi:hypothetical protein
MMDCDDPGFSHLDAYIRLQLARAAETYAQGVDIEARLAAILGTSHEDGCTAADERGGLGSG